MATADNLDTIRSFTMLVAAVIGLIAATLSLLNTRLKEADTPEAKQAVYRSATEWIETVLWLVGLPLSIFLSHAPIWALCAWVAAYAMGVYHFLSADNPNRLRADIFKLVFGAQSVLFMIMIVISQMFMSLFGQLLKTLSKALTE